MRAVRRWGDEGASYLERLRRAGAGDGQCGTALPRRLLILCKVALTMVVASACGSGSGGADDRVGRGETETPSDALAWAGLPDVEGLEVVDAGGEAGIDTLRMFLLRGSAEDVDRALAAAEFDVPPVTGKQVAQPPLEGFEPELLADVVSGEDRWGNAPRLSQASGIMHVKPRRHPGTA